MRSPPALLTVLIIGCINLCPRALSRPTFSPSLRPSSSSKRSSRPSSAPSVLSLPTQTSFLSTIDNSVNPDQKSTPKIVYFLGLIMCFGLGLIFFVRKSLSRDESGGGDNDAEAIVAEILQDIEMSTIAAASDSGPTRDNKKRKDDSSDNKRSRGSDVNKKSRRRGDSKRRTRSNDDRSQRKPSHSDDVSEVDDDADDEGLDERGSRRGRKRKSDRKSSLRWKDYEDDDAEHNEESARESKWKKSENKRSKAKSKPRKAKASRSDIDIEEEEEEEVVSVVVVYSSSSSESFDPLEDDVESAAGSASLIRRFGGEITVPYTKKGDTSVVGSVSTASEFGGLSAITMSVSQADSSVSEEVETVCSYETPLRENQNHRGSKQGANKPSQRHGLSTIDSVSSDEGEVSLSDSDVSMYVDEAATLSLQDMSWHSLASM